MGKKYADWIFLLPRPSRGVTLQLDKWCQSYSISTPTPLAGRDCISFDDEIEVKISTPTPLAGRDWGKQLTGYTLFYFYSHAPRGA